MNDSAYVGEKSIGIIIIMIFALFIFISVICLVSPQWTREYQIEINIVEKIPYHDGKYLIVAEVDGFEEVFTVADEPILLTFNASDRYAYLKEGGKYTVSVCGYRYPLFSWYRNIYQIQTLSGVL